MTAIDEVIYSADVPIKTGETKSKSKESELSRCAPMFNIMSAARRHK